MIKINLKNNKKGFTLLFAVLVSVLMLSVGASIVNLSVKQIILSGSSRESQYAFYAANTGIECVYYWDLNPPAAGRVFATSSASVPLSSTDDITCIGRSIYDDYEENVVIQGLEVTDDGGGFATSEFWLTFDEVGYPYCAYVIVKKNGGETQIHSYGYNTCDLDNPRRIERGLRVNY